MMMILMMILMMMMMILMMVILMMILMMMILMMILMMMVMILMITTENPNSFYCSHSKVLCYVLVDILYVDWRESEFFIEKISCSKS